MWPCTISKPVFTAFSTGTMALVVQEAAPSSTSFWFITEELTPETMFLIVPLAGAVSSTLAVPLDSRCLPMPASSRHTPVLSMTIAFWMP